MTEQTGLIGGDGEGRDVVQRRLKRSMTTPSFGAP